MTGFRNTLKELLRYPSAIVGLTIISFYLAISVYAMVAIPYHDAINLWKAGTNVWYKNPKYAQPAWTNFFRSKKLPVTVDFNTANGTAQKVTQSVGESTQQITETFTFDFNYNSFPSDMTVFFSPTFQQKKPLVNMIWIQPDGTQIQVGRFSVDVGQTYSFSQDQKLEAKLNGMLPQEGLFVKKPAAGDKTVEQGKYQLQIQAFTFEPNSDLNTELVVYGDLYGLAGTDNLRRDLMVALLWGTPVALAFGLLAALGTTVTTMAIAATGTWFGGWVDALIQRITEVNLVLPFLPILIMIGYFYSRSIWVILGATILLSIFGASIKSYRSIFLQVKEAPFIEAARAYGAGNGRVIFSYLVPRIIPLIIPQLVTLIPTYVFLEASLSVLGLGDPVMPTWGKIINDAQMNGALYQGLYYWVLEPAVLLVVAGLAFALLGFTLDRVFNPRLRGL